MSNENESIWNGIRFLNTRRRNNEALITLNRADSAKSPYFWDEGVTRFRDGTYGIRKFARHTLNALQVNRGESGILTIRFEDDTLNIPGFHLISFGGTLFERISPEAEVYNQIPGSLGSVDYTLAGFNQRRLDYTIRCWARETLAEIWRRYATGASHEL